MTQALFELAIYPKSQLEEIRNQVRQALAEEGGWSKASLARFHKLDSLLREVGRFHGLMQCKPTFCHPAGTLTDA
jgi:hypothetical protein